MNSCYTSPKNNYFCPLLSSVSIWAGSSRPILNRSAAGPISGKFVTCWDKNTKLEPKALGETLAVRRLHKETSTLVQVPPQMNRTSSPQRAWEPESKNNLDSQSFSGCLQGAPPKFRGAASDPLQRYWVNRGGVSSTRGKRTQEEGIHGEGQL